MKLTTNKKIGFSTVTTIFVCFFLGFILWMLMMNQAQSHAYEYDKGWTVVVNRDTIMKADRLSDLSFHSLQVGDTVELMNVLPEDLEEDQTLSFLIYLSTVDVWVGDELLYSYGQDYFAKNWLVGSGYHFVDLPDDCSGKTVNIRFFVTEPDAFTSIEAPLISNSNEVYWDYAESRGLANFVCGFLTLLGALLAIISAAALFFNRTFLRLLYIGVFSFLMGIWSMCNMKVWQIYNIDLAASTTVEYITLYLAPIVFFLMMGEMNRAVVPWKRQSMHGVVILMSAFAVVTTLLHFTNIEHYPRLLNYFHIFSATSLIVIFVCCFTKGRKRNPVDNCLLVGVVLLATSVILDLIRFNVQKYIFPEATWLNVSVIPVGTLLFVVMLLISYAFYVYNLLKVNAQKEWLEERVYHDALCRIYNRTKCSERFQEIDDKEEAYAFVNLDLNGLKTLNDTYGHQQGDSMLVEFASILSQAFEEVGEVYRMGGDEFLVIVMGDKIDKIDACLVALENLQTRKSMELSYKLEASYGVARSVECIPSKTEKVYTLADQRMYEMKESKKRGRRLL